MTFLKLENRQKGWNAKVSIRFSNLNQGFWGFRFYFAVFSPKMCQTQIFLHLKRALKLKFNFPSYL